MDRNDLRWVLDASDTHYRVILMHFCPVLVGSPYSFGAKSGQNGLNLDQNGLSKVPSAAGKCWQSAFLVTKMRFASPFQHCFILMPGWVGGSSVPARIALSFQVNAQPFCLSQLTRL